MSRKGRGMPRQRRPTGSLSASPARTCALSAALLAAKRGVQLDAALETALADAEVSLRDRRLAEEIAFGAVRHRGSIDLVLQEVSSRPLDEIQLAVLESLRQAVYQTFFLERIPEHAAVNEAVSLCRLYAGRKAGGFANAVLRAALELRAGREPRADGNARSRAALSFRGGELILLSKELVPDPDLDLRAWLAGHYSYPSWLTGCLLRELGSDAAESVLAWGNSIPHLCVRVNRLKCDAGELEALSPSELCAPGALFSGCSRVERGESPWCFSVEVEREIGSLHGMREGLFSIQDAAQQRVAEALAPRAGESILDLCAAPGGKSTHIAEISEDRGEVLACDAAAERLELVTAAAARLGLQSVRTRQMQLPPLDQDLAGGFDAVLADVPCSNSGSMNRRVESRWWAGPDQVEALAEKQRAILGCALRAARPGGRVLYATCSLLQAENGDLVRSVLESGSGARLVREQLTLPVAGRRDGGYFALLEV
jgi:16S rRNA (cytosine967-C5)-methyltransferase